MAKENKNKKAKTETTTNDKNKTNTNNLKEETKPKNKPETVRDNKKKDQKENKDLAVNKITATSVNEAKGKKEKTNLNNKNKPIEEEPKVASNTPSTVKTINKPELSIIDDSNTEDIKEVFQTKLKEVNSKLTLNETQITKAIKGLKKLLDIQFENELNIFKRKDEEYLQINFTFGNLPMEYSLRPNVLPVKINNKAKRKVCLIIRDPVESWEKLNINFEDNKDLIVNIIPFSELKLEYERFEQKRNLLKQFDVFVCDNHIYHSLKKILGRDFYDDKKYPIGVTINYNGKDDKEIKQNAENAKTDIIKAATHYLFYMSNGPNYTVRAGFVEEEEKKLVSNVVNISKHTLAHILKWGVDFEHLKSVTLKFNNSIELPIFNQLSELEVKAGLEILNNKGNEKKAEKNKEKKDKKIK